MPIVNKTDNVVRFTHFGCNCGCTSGKLTSEELQTGQFATLRMTIDVSGREGSQRFSCQWSDESGRRWSAEVRVVIYRPVQFNPSAMRLGHIVSGETIGRRVYCNEYATTMGDLPPLPNFSISSSIHREAVSLKINSSVVENLGSDLVRRQTTIDMSLIAASRSGYNEVFLVASAPAGSSTSSLLIDWSVRHEPPQDWWTLS